MTQKLDIDVKLEVLFNEETGKYKILSNTPIIRSQKKIDEIIESTYKVKFSDLRYGVLTLGAKNLVGKEIPKGDSITVTFGKSITAKSKAPNIGSDVQTVTASTHKSAKGRIDGLTKLFEYFDIPHGYKLEGTDDDYSVEVGLKYNIYEKNLLVYFK